MGDVEDRRRWLLEFNDVNKFILWFMPSRSRRIVVVSINFDYPTRNNQDSNSACAANQKPKSSPQIKSIWHQPKSMTSKHSENI